MTAKRIVCRTTTPAYRGLMESKNVGFHPVRPDVDVTAPELLGRVMDRRDLTAAPTARILAH